MCDRVDKVINQIVDIHNEYGNKLQKGQIKDADSGADVVILSHGHFSRCKLTVRLRIGRFSIFGNRLFS